MKKASAVILATVFALVGLAACGDDDESSDTGTAVETTTEATDTAAGGAAGSGGTIEISAAPDGSFAYQQDSVETSAGSVTVAFDNPAPLSHDVVIEDDSGTTLGETDLISNDSTKTTVDLQPGTYTFYCSVPGHREGGMEGTLTVK